MANRFELTNLKWLFRVVTILVEESKGQIIVQTQQLGRTDLEVSCIEWGVLPVGRSMRRNLSRSDYAFDQGISLLDTAAYAAGASEIVVGRWIKERKCRDKVVLATKVNGNLTRELRWITSAEESLKRLQTDQIDLFQLHSWDNEASLEETLTALTDLVTRGKVRYIGCGTLVPGSWRRADLHEADHRADLSLFSPLQPGPAARLKRIISSVRTNRWASSVTVHWEPVF
ncbi:MAG: aldo/keto reductase [Planctomycetaceae bacterium]